VPHTAPATTAFDYIVVGGGTAGCVLARRLSDDPDVSVLLLEQGERYPRVALTIPLVSKRFIGKYLDPVETVPQRHCGDRRVAFSVPRVLGGGSAVNTMIHLRAQPEAYERWTEMGARGWGYRDVLPYFRSMENYEGGSDSWHGVGGPVDVSRTRFRSRFGDAFVEACIERGLSRNDDFNGASQAGAGLYQFTQANGARSSTARGHLGPAARRPNLTVWVRSRVHRLLVQGSRAVGASGTRRSRPFAVSASREVVLAAGALGSPRLLLLSGIGPAGELDRVGIPPVHDLPGVGRGLQDHPRCSVLYRAAKPVSLSPLSLLRALVQWGVTRRGLLTSPVVAAGAFLTIQPDSPLLDCQLVATWTGGPADRAAVGIHAMLMQVESRGSVRLASPDPRDPLLVDPNYLSSSHDRHVLVEAIRRIRDLAGTTAMRRFGLVEELRPGAAMRSDHELTRYLEQDVQTAYHPAGTCAMGSGPHAVVDPELRVHGMEGLRIADASVMPSLVNANTNGPTLMIAEKAADLIRGRRPVFPE
jgi:choline dehydrogenase-like flavoprotein